MAQHPDLIPEGSRVRRRRHRSEAAESNLVKTPSEVADHVMCPDCSGVTLTRQRRNIVDRFFFRNNILLCPQCGHRQWGQNVVAARKVALSIVGTAWVSLFLYAAIAFAPVHRGKPVAKPLDRTVTVPMVNRANLTPEQYRGMLSRMAKGQPLIPPPTEVRVSSKPLPPSKW